MSALLQFTLGLATGPFISGLDEAGTKLKGFLAGMIGLEAVVEGVKNAMEKGAGLKQLSDQTGESIGNLYKVQQGLKAVGLDGSIAGTMLFQMNKALGGINEAGEPTAAVFGQLGLSIQDLKRLDAPTQLRAIGTAINRLDQSSATAAAGKIFGKFGARDFLQLSRNADEFTDALRRGGTQAAIFDRFGRTFEKIEILVSQIKENFSGLFLGIAAGIGPALENILKLSEQIDFSKIGAQIGTFITALTQAFREGKFSQLIADSLKLGFESIIIYAPAVFEKVGFTLLKAFETPLIYLQAGMEFALENGIHAAMSALISNPVFARFLAITPGGSQIVAAAAQLDSGKHSFADILKERQKEGVKFNLGSGEFGLDEIGQDTDRRMATANAAFQNKWKGFWGGIVDLADRAPQPDAAKKGARQANASFGNNFIPERTALEKMGFVFRGGTGADPASQTAKNTAMMVTQLQNLNANIKAGFSFGDNLIGATRQQSAP